VVPFSHHSAFQIAYLQFGFFNFSLTQLFVLQTMSALDDFWLSFVCHATLHNKILQQKRIQFHFIHKLVLKGY